MDPRSSGRPAAGARGGRSRSNESHELHLPGRCELSGLFCDCRAAGPDQIERVLERGGARLVLVGARATDEATVELAREARRRGFAEVVLRTTAIEAMTDDAARVVAAAGVSAVLVPLFSASPRVHDRIAGRDDALAHSLVGIRALAARGVGVELLVPLLSTRLQDPEALVELAHRALPALRAVHFFAAPRVPSPALGPPALDEGGPALARAVRRARSLGVAARIGGGAGIPLCAVRDAPDVQDAFTFDPRGRAQRAAGTILAAVCAGCAVERQCPGPSAAYRSAHGERGLAPYGRKPKELYRQRSAGSPVFTAEHHRAASRAGMVVLRPTVNCNQDCTFCSANETSDNVWTDSRTMLRAIVRAAQRGVERVSFGGGEPTLSRDLPHYVSAARRLGVRKIELVTNGVLLASRERVERLRAAGVTEAFVSLHAHDERLSRSMTRKAGDHERTVRAIHHLLDAGVVVAVNHVITSRNYPYLRRFVEFVRSEFGGRLMISFAFVTPQFKVLEDMSQLPRLSEVMPYLRHALHRAIEVGQEVSVGSRQGIPPCFLGEFQGWSDILGVVSEAESEDAPQKQQAPACAECRYRKQCTGLWRPYVSQYGVSEVVPIRGEAFSDDELRAIRETPRASTHGGLCSLEGLPAALRDPVAEAAGLERYRAEGALPVPAVRALPVVDATHTRPTRVAMIGSGRQARRLARALGSVPTLAIAAVASPNAPESSLPELGGCPAYRSLAEVMEEARPDALVVAASTAAHADLLGAAVAAGLPTLLEKPPTRTEAEAEALLAGPAGGAGARVLVAHNLLFAPGLAEVLAARTLPVVALVRKVPPTSGERLRAWSREALYQQLYHLFAVVSYAVGGGTPRITGAHHHGDSAPLQVRLEVEYPGGSASLTLDFDAMDDELAVTRRASAGAAVGASWWRRGGHTLSRVGDGPDVRHTGGELEAMLAHFSDVALGRAEPRVTLRDGLGVMRAARAAIEALEASGVAFDRKDGPRHVASPGARVLSRT